MGENDGVGAGHEDVGDARGHGQGDETIDEVEDEDQVVVHQGPRWEGYLGAVREEN